VKNQFLKEKNDLQTRFFQIRDLNTQLSGTMKKKEKDFDKLQNQMSKVVKDAAKAAKASIVSVPLKKSLVQETSANVTPGKSLLLPYLIMNSILFFIYIDVAMKLCLGTALLKDAEVSSLRNTLTALTNENLTLRSSMTVLQEEVSSLQAHCSTVMLDAQRKVNDTLKELNNMKKTAGKVEKDVKVEIFAPASPGGTNIVASPVSAI
jgi:predicted nuclease with TOPRIM domain